MQWIKRFASSPSGWVELMSFWFRFFFDASPQEVFSSPHAYNADVLLPFYSALLKAWRAVRGSGSVSGLVVASSSANPLSVDMVSCKICYQLLLSFNPCVPHCVTKFQASYQIDWPSLGGLSFSCPLTGRLLTLVGK